MLAMKLKIPNKNYGITELYDTVANILGYKNTLYDCTKINVARNIHDSFLKYYRETIPHRYESDLRMSVSMLLLNYGPKVDETLADDEVEVFNGFIC
jgi:hypothetical protein